MTKLVLMAHRREFQVTCVWHPEAKGEFLESMNLGNIRVRVGEPHIQLSTGDVIFADAL